MEKLKVRVDSDINGITAKWLRQREKMPQREFWGAIGVSQASGSHYEVGVRRIPAVVKKALFMRYEAGIKFDTGTVQGAQILRDFAANQAASNQGKV